MPLEFRLAICMFVGALAGGFINFGIYRFAWNKRLISPWSPAPKGAAPRTWADRIPILGWLLLPREAALHGAGFWIRPMLVELGTAAAFAGLYVWEVHFGGLFPAPATFPAAPVGRMLEPITAGMIHGSYVSHLILLVLMMIATFIDIDEKTIPDQVTLTGTLAGLILATSNPWSLLPAQTFRLPTGLESEFLHSASPLVWPTPLHGGLSNQWSLAIALGCFWLWCFAILPRAWHGRYGIRRATKYFFARIIRDWYSWLVMLVWLVGSIAITAVWWNGVERWAALLTSLIGMATGAVLIWAVRLMGRVILRKEAMGFGDVTLMAMIGAFLGWQVTLIVFFLAPVAALAIGLFQLIVLRSNIIPYGPFLCLATAVSLIYWRMFWGYLSDLFAIPRLVPMVMIACMALMAILLLALQGVKRILWRNPA